MNCLYCRKPLTAVVNSRSTKDSSQIWRRRKCLNCKEVFTTHEVIDLSQLVVIKKSGKAEKYSRMKLYSGILKASQSSKVTKRELFLDKVTDEIEKEILLLKQKRVESSIIAEIVLRILRKRHTPTFLRFITYCRDISTDNQMKRELSKYLTDDKN